MAKSIVTAELAGIPNAVPHFVRKPDRALPYRWWTRLADRWAGWRDRTEAAASRQDSPMADTPWLTRLISETATRLAHERIVSEALVAVLDRGIAEQQARIEAAHAFRDLAEAELNALKAAQVTNVIVGTGEHFSSEEERLHRRVRERSKKFRALDRAREAATEEIRDACGRIEVLRQERHSHWVVLQERSHRLVEHTKRRAASYVRGMERRRKGITWRVPEIEIPVWMRAELSTGGQAIVEEGEK